MISNLKHHDNLQQFIRLESEQPVTHRVYSFGNVVPNIPTLAREIYELTGIKIMAETNQDEKRGMVESEELHGFISTVRLPAGVQGTCEWCLESGEEGQPHTCAIITLYENYYEEMPVIEQAIEAIIQVHHQNISNSSANTP